MVNDSIGSKETAGQIIDFPESTLLTSQQLTLVPPRVTLVGLIRITSLPDFEKIAIDPFDNFI
jgi:hypothetical protein